MKPKRPVSRAKVAPKKKPPTRRPAAKADVAQGGGRQKDHSTPGKLPAVPPEVYKKELEARRLAHRILDRVNDRDFRKTVEYKRAVDRLGVLNEWLRSYYLKFAGTAAAKKF